jgi:hypothetical protein
MTYRAPGCARTSRSKRQRALAEQRPERRDRRRGHDVAVVQQAIASDALVDHAEVVQVGRGPEARGEEVGIAVVRADGRVGPVGDRVPERDDRAGRARPHAHSGKEVPLLDHGGVLDARRPGDVAGRHQVLLEGGAVQRGRRRSLREVDAHRQIGPGEDVERDRVAHRGRAPWDRDRGAAGERQPPIRVGRDVRTLAGQASHVGLADGQRAIPELVRQADAHPAAGAARVDDLSQRLILELRHDPRPRAGRRARGRRAPRADPGASRSVGRGPFARCRRLGDQRNGQAHGDGRQRARSSHR